MADEQFFLVVVVVDGDRELPGVEAGPDPVAENLGEMMEFLDPNDVNFPQSPRGLVDPR